jgi:hypothetical protein
MPNDATNDSIPDIIPGSQEPASMHATPPLLESAPLAYENPEFLNSPEGRIVRILAEYSEPLARFRHEGIQDTIVFFGSARFHCH